MCSNHDYHPNMIEVDMIQIGENGLYPFFGENNPLYQNCPNCDHIKSYHAKTHGCIVPMGSDGQNTFYCNCNNKYVEDFTALHKLWMENNDPNMWAWPLPNRVLLEKFSEALRGANEMRKRAMSTEIDADFVIAEQVFVPRTYSAFVEIAEKVQRQNAAFFAASAAILEDYN